MIDDAKKILKTLIDNGYNAYIVGGYVRDSLLGIKSNDIDITTNATPKEVKKLFKEALPNDEYGSVSIIIKGHKYEVTTFRKENNYIDNRRPSEVIYINDLYQDLLRRDFTINTLCMNIDGEIFDFLLGKKDLKHKLIRTVGDSETRFKEDSLRILRAIRFATIFNFKLEKETYNGILKTRSLLRNLSYNRKKEELDKIFSSKYASKGIKLMIKLGLDTYLDLPNLSKVKYTRNLIGIWSVLDVDNIYPFTNNELNLLSKLKEVSNLNNLDPYVLYKYGLYINAVSASIKGISNKRVINSYNKLVIHKRSDIDISSQEIINLYDKGPGKYINSVYNKLEYDILYKKVVNKNNILKKYIVDNYM